MIEFVSKASARTSEALALPPKWLAAYSDFIIKNASAVSQIESALRSLDLTCGVDGLMTYVWRSRVQSENPGYCFKCAGYRKIGESADGRKDLLQKPWDRAGLALEPSLHWRVPAWA